MGNKTRQKVNYKLQLSPLHSQKKRKKNLHPEKALDGRAHDGAVGLVGAGDLAVVLHKREEVAVAGEVGRFPAGGLAGAVGAVGEVVDVGGELGGGEGLDVRGHFFPFFSFGTLVCLTLWSTQNWGDSRVTRTK